MKVRFAMHNATSQTIQLSFAILIYHDIDKEAFRLKANKKPYLALVAMYFNMPNTLAVIVKERCSVDYHI